MMSLDGLFEAIIMNGEGGDGRTNGRTNGRTDERTDRRTDERTE